MGRGLVSSILILVVVLALFWLAGELLGFEIAFWTSLALSIGLTLVLNPSRASQK